MVRACLQLPSFVKGFSLTNGLVQSCRCRLAARVALISPNMASAFRYSCLSHNPDATPLVLDGPLALQGGAPGAGYCTVVSAGCRPPTVAVFLTVGKEAADYDFMAQQINKMCIADQGEFVKQWVSQPNEDMAEA